MENRVSIYIPCFYIYLENDTSAHRRMMIYNIWAYGMYIKSYVHFWLPKGLGAPSGHKTPKDQLLKVWNTNILFYRKIPNVMGIIFYKQIFS